MKACLDVLKKGVKMNGHLQHRPGVQSYAASGLCVGRWFLAGAVVFLPCNTVLPFVAPMARYFAANRQLLDIEWLTSATPAQRRALAHTILAFPCGNHHDACLILRQDGNVGSVPYLIHALRWIPEYECTHQHCLDALRSITGENPGGNYESWRNWWDSKGHLRAPGPTTGSSSTLQDEQ